MDKRVIRPAALPDKEQFQICVAHTGPFDKKEDFFNTLTEVARKWELPAEGDRPRTTACLIPLFKTGEDVQISEEARNSEVHVVIHKLIRDKATPARSAKYFMAQKRIEILESQFKMGAMEYDDLGGVWTTTDRVLTAKCIDRAFQNQNPSSQVPDESGGEEKVCVLKWVHFSKKEDIQQVVNNIELSLCFPIILKWGIAAGTIESHKMVLAANADASFKALSLDFGMAKREPDGNLGDEAYANILMESAHTIRKEDVILAQEYVQNHGGQVFKVYGVKEHIEMKIRSSLPDNACGMKEGYFSFDSQHMKPSSPQFPGPIGHRSGSSKAMIPSWSLLMDIVSRIRKEVPISMIGIDVVYDVTQTCFSIVDVNYFPSFRNINDVFEWILEDICSKFWESQERLVSNNVST